MALYTSLNPRNVLSLKQRLLYTHELWRRNINRWQFLIDSYLGGQEYRDGKYLTAYQMESQEDYETRLDTTPYDNHVKSIVAIYNSFLFRDPPMRKWGSLENDPSIDFFLKDCDLDGRSFDAMMRDISTYAAVYGHIWVIIDKPPSNAFTRAEELQQEIRPYMTIYTPENVLDWTYERAANGMYYLTYLKTFEGNIDGEDRFREYRRDTVKTYTIGGEGEPRLEMEFANDLGRVPAVCVYGQRSPSRGVGISLVGDVADMGRAIYNELSEIEQVGRLTNHPSLVKTADTAAGAGAGAIIQLPHDLQPELKPYLLQPDGASLEGFLNSIEAKIGAIDRMAHMGGIRSIETRRLSGIALSTEFQLLNSALAALADNLELAEEQIWRLYAQWQGMAWDGEIKYPDSFNIQDKYNDMNMLKLAKDAQPRSDIVHEIIEREMLKILAEEEEYQDIKDLVKTMPASEPQTQAQDMGDVDREIIVNGYQTRYHYMCPSAVLFAQKMIREGRTGSELTEIARLSDRVFEIEAVVENTRTSTDAQIREATDLVQRIKDLAEVLVGDDGLVGYMDLHLDAVINPSLAGTFKNNG